MNFLWRKLSPLLLVLILLLSACGGEDDNTTEDPTDINDAGIEATETNPDIAATDPAPADAEGNEEALNTWLQQVNNDEIEGQPIDETLEWNEGYLVYYGSIDSLAIDNLIYNALEVHRRLDTGEVTEENLSESEQNLLEITEEIEYNSEVELTEQIAQTPEIRNAIIEHIAQSQQDLSPQEALDSNNIVGVIGPPAPESIGSKYLVFKQETPDAEYEFLGVILAVDATSADSREPYSVGEWENLSWLGDASGPFWDDLPAGVSGDPTSTEEGRPGVLLVSEATFNDLQSGAFQSSVVE